MTDRAWTRMDFMQSRDLATSPSDDVMRAQHDVMGGTISHSSRWTPNLLLSEGRSEWAPYEVSTLQRTEVPNCGKRRRKKHRLPPLTLWSTEVRQEGWRHRLDYDVTKQGPFLSTSSLIHVYIKLYHALSKNEPNKKKEHLWEVPNIKKMLK